jgi:hypothetical protein
MVFGIPLRFAMCKKDYRLSQRLDISTKKRSFFASLKLK